MDIVARRQIFERRINMRINDENMYNSIFCSIHLIWTKYHALEITEENMHLEKEDLTRVINHHLPMNRRVALRLQLNEKNQKEITIVTKDETLRLTLENDFGQFGYSVKK